MADLKSLFGTWSRYFTRPVGESWEDFLDKIHNIDWMSIGDGTNDVDISEDGVYLHGAARMWDDVVAPAISTKPGSTAPTWGTFRDNVEAWLFGAASSNAYLTAQFQLPHRYDEGTDIELHIHWSPMSTNTGNVKWEAEFTMAPIDGTFPSTTVITVLDAGDGTTYKHQVAGFATIDGSAEGISSIMNVRIRRLGADAQDTYTGDAAFHYADLHVVINSMGSDDEYVKGP